MSEKPEDSVVISYSSFRGKLRRLEVKHGAEVWNWKIILRADQEPIVRIIFQRGDDSPRFIEELPLRDFPKYEDDEPLIYSSFRGNRTSMGCKESRLKDNPFYPK